MNIFYFVHVTGKITRTGVPRVVKNLAREFLAVPSVRLIPVSWSRQRQALVYADQKLLDNLGRHGGPEMHKSALNEPTITAESGDWLFFAEVPHLRSHDLDSPSVSIISPMGFARRLGIKIAAVLHDILPLSHRNLDAADARQRFRDIFHKEAARDEDDLESLKFTIYAQAMANVDLVLPVSRTSGDILRDWLLQNGYPVTRLPTIIPVPLPEEIFGTTRQIPDLSSASIDGPIEFLSIGTVCAQKINFAQCGRSAAWLRKDPI